MKKVITISIFILAILLLTESLRVRPLVNPFIFSSEEIELNRRESRFQADIFLLISIIISAAGVKLLIARRDILKNGNALTVFILLGLVILAVVCRMFFNNPVTINERRQVLTLLEMRKIEILINRPDLEYPSKKFADQFSTRMRFDSWGNPYVFRKTEHGIKIICSSIP